jgi:ferric-dicitrate binding protein FerR (iron transport regulator)
MDKNFTVEELLTDGTFTDYCLNENSPYKKEWDTILAGNQQLKKTADEARQLLGMLSPVVPAHEIDAEVNKLREALSAEEFFESPIVKRREPARLLLYVLPVLVLLAAGLYFFLPRQPAHRLASKFETHLGERKQYILPDGSTVILNSNSSFSFDEHFGQRSREIEMMGDAFFKVAKNPSKPFIVKSNGFSTTAIGTAFYVHTGKSASEYHVDLLEGKVKLEKNASGETSYLTAGQKASWTITNSRFNKQQYDTATLNKWVKGVLTFDNTPVNEALREIESWYSVTIEDRRKNPGNITINGDYINAPLEDVMKIICFSLSCNYHYEDNKIIIQ